jgi:hypothetical protein
MSYSPLRRAFPKNRLRSPRWGPKAKTRALTIELSALGGGIARFQPPTARFRADDTHQRRRNVGPTVALWKLTSDETSSPCRLPLAVRPRLARLRGSETGAGGVHDASRGE